MGSWSPIQMSEKIFKLFLRRETSKDPSAPLSTDTRWLEGLFWQVICVEKGETEEKLETLTEGRAGTR